MPPICRFRMSRYDLFHMGTAGSVQAWHSRGYNHTLAGLTRKTLFHKMMGQNKLSADEPDNLTFAAQVC